MKKFFFANKGIATLVVCIVLFAIFSWFPKVAEVVYRNGFFQALRCMWDFTIGQLPVPVPLVLVPLLLILWVYSLITKTLGWKKRLARGANFLCFSIALFFIMWGFNYCCPLLQERIVAEKKPMTDEELFSFGIEVNDATRGLLSEREHADSLSFMLDEDAIRQLVENQVAQFGLPTAGRVRLRMLSENGTMRKLGIAGVYMPYFGEGYTNDTYLPITQAFIAAHEMSHGYGVTHEGEADMIAYLALASSENKYLRYAAQVELMRNIRGKLQRISPDLSQELKSQTDSMLNNSLRDIYINGLAYSEYVPGVQEALNNTYLQLMGVEDGTKSYDSFVELVRWKKGH